LFIEVYKPVHSLQHESTKSGLIKLTQKKHINRPDLRVVCLSREAQLNL